MTGQGEGQEWLQPKVLEMTNQSRREREFERSFDRLIQIER